jgi:hypothetical protein
MIKKSILEQALLQVQTLEEAVKQNAKGILASTMKQELNDLLKESMEEEDDVIEQTEPEEKEDDVMGMSMDDDTDVDDEEEGEEEEEEEEDGEYDEEGEDEEEDEEEDDYETMDMTGASDEDDYETMDMTGASDEEIIKIFKAMKPEDGVIVKKDGNSINFKDGENDYIIKLDDEDETHSFSDFKSFQNNELNEMRSKKHSVYGHSNKKSMYEMDYQEMDDEEMVYEMDDEEMDYEMDNEEMDYQKNMYEMDDQEMDDDEIMYEIDLDGEEEPEQEMKEAARTKSNVHGNKGGLNRAGLKSKTMYKAGSGAMNEEVSKLRKQNSEYKKALILFKEKLNEVAVFNASLAYSTRLFTEHSTTKQEKLNILKRFDNITNMTESKNLFKTIQNELNVKKPINETVVNKLTKTPSTSTSKNMLSESKAYENPEFKRIKDLMGKIK